MMHDERATCLSGLAPVTDAEFAAALAPLIGPPADLAVAVSGGPDSLALWALARRWCAAHGRRALALIVDHGLRAASAAEAAGTAARIVAAGGEARVLTLAPPSLAGSPQAWARAARYAALAEACRDARLIHLLTGHHADDQAETVLERLSRGSGPHGLAGMSAIRPLEPGVVLLRPLLCFTKARLAGRVPWPAVDDPSNRDPRFARTRWRRLLAHIDRDTVLDLARAAAALRAADAAALAALLADAVRPDAAGLRVSPALLCAAPPRLAGLAIGRIAACAGGTDRPPEAIDPARLLEPGPLAIGQSLWRREDEWWRVGRAPRRLPTARLDPAGTLWWDGRWRLRLGPDAPPGLTIAALGPGALPEARRAAGLSDWLAATLPALRLGGAILAVPLLRPASWLDAEALPRQTLA